MRWSGATQVERANLRHKWEQALARTLHALQEVCTPQESLTNDPHLGLDAGAWVQQHTARENGGALCVLGFAMS